MKNLIYKILVIVFIAGVFNSCSENLDQLPFDEFATENAFVTRQILKTELEVFTVI